MSKREWKVSKEAMNIGQAMTAGVLLEVACEPSPGLVSPNSAGAHGDMNMMSFLLSSAAIAPYFSLFAQLGRDWDEEEPLLEVLRPHGINAEKEFLALTDQVNTQRGILFVGGIVAAAAGMAGKTGKITAVKISQRVALICEGIVQRELESVNPNGKNSNGEKLFMEHHLTGIRGEVEKGLPSVMEVGYPVFCKSMNQGMGLNDSMVHTLIHLFNCVEDTTVASRLGPHGLKKCKDASKIVIEKGSMETEEGRRALKEMDDYFIKENISPGGCADLLAIIVGIYLLEGHSLELESILRREP
ncbi:triphosphoribosyl-dephospho-CoA synthase [Isachenkonia alkalipeptolytica]|uniref:triphosphoribosyl-dephospho-CoA synthase n=1 Tax=Isachenkonia alkalipeptolytica TaxID=2565777 RepID=A0AA43XHY5_9CLOT|nr:triphosphoribosyl-dephospho-CoA synthase [Isachenkonia alkalipeptolytica]NBG87173.1 triphosphoribosyl-dephospho-CoA synthase MdcB [Isachenkonia alkalipeptolytica]